MAKNPKQSVMYMVGPMKDPSLINTYNRYRIDPAKDNILIPIDGRVFEASAESVVYDKMRTRERNLKTRGVPTDPFIDLLKLPASVRPDSFQECVDFFYPNSGVRSRPSDKSPFVSTSISAYSFPTEIDKWGKPSQNTIPQSLGEVSMMYGWFIMYRLLLCPNKFSNVPLVEADKLFLPAKVYDLVTKAKVDVTRDILSKTKTLSVLKSAISLARQVSKYAGPAALPKELSKNVSDTLAAVRANRELLDLVSKGSNAIVDLVQSSLGWDKTTSTLFACFILDGFIPSKKFKALSKPIQDIIRELAVYELINLHKLTPNDAYALTQESDSAITAVPPSKVVLAKLTPAGAQYIKDLYSKLNSQQAVEYLSYALREDVKKPTAQLKGGVRANDAALSAVGLSLLQNALGTFMDQAKATSDYQKAKEKTYYASILYEIHPMFSELGYSFGFDSYQNDGLLNRQGYLVGADVNKTVYPQAPKSVKGRIKRYVDEGNIYWELYPTQAIQNGGETLAYWTEVYRVLRPIIDTLRKNPKMSVSAALNNALQTSYTAPDRFPNPTFRVFMQNVLQSTIAVFANMDAYSPFTHTFGFAPTVLFNNPNIQGQEELLGLKGNLYSAKTPDMIVIGSPSHQYLKPVPSASGAVYYEKFEQYRKSQSYPQGFAPGQSSVYAYEKKSDLADASLNASNKYLSDWKTQDLLNSTGFSAVKSTPGTSINSQRRINDTFAGPLSVGFDVSLNVPIFNAQWSAVMSVLMCYPEALSSLARNYPWASTLKNQIFQIQKDIESAARKAAEASKAKALEEAKAALTAMKLPGVPVAKAPVLPTITALPTVKPQTPSVTPTTYKALIPALKPAPQVAIPPQPIAPSVPLTTQVTPSTPVSVAQVAPSTPVSVTQVAPSTPVSVTQVEPSTPVSVTQAAPVEVERALSTLVEPTSVESSVSINFEDDKGASSTGTSFEDDTQPSEDVVDEELTPEEVAQLMKDEPSTTTSIAPVEEVKSSNTGMYVLGVLAIGGVGYAAYRYTKGKK